MKDLRLLNLFLGRSLEQQPSSIVMATTFSTLVLICAIAAVAQGVYVFRESSDIDLGDLVSEFTSRVGEDPELFQQLSKHIHMLSVNCSGDKCSVCVHLPLLGEMCVDISTPRDTVTFEATRKGLELLSVEFVNKLPKVCAFHHLCIQVTDLEIENGKLCASLLFNQKMILHNHCFPLED